MSWCAPAVVVGHYLWVGFVQLLSPEWILAPPCNGKRQGRVCLNRGPNCFDVSRPVVPGGARHTWGVAPAAIHHPVGPQLFLHKLPAILDLHLKPRKFGSKTGGAAPHRPNFGRLDQSMQITAAMQLHLHLKR